jgi:hypothetical protein
MLPFISVISCEDLSFHSFNSKGAFLNLKYVFQTFHKRGKRNKKAHSYFKHLSIKDLQSFYLTIIH